VLRPQLIFYAFITTGILVVTSPMMVKAKCGALIFPLGVQQHEQTCPLCRESSAEKKLHDAARLISQLSQHCTSDDLRNKSMQWLSDNRLQPQHPVKQLGSHP
jgi:hypothetical protein